MSLLLLLVACANDVVVQRYNEPPTASIQSPPNGTTRKEGEIIDFIGTANDDQTPSNELFVQWSSDIDSVLTTEKACAVSGSCTYSTAQLTPGNHTITLSVGDQQGEVAESHITVVIEEVPDAPTIQMVHPAAGETSDEGDDFTFMVKVSDEQDTPDLLYVSFTYEGEAGLTEFCTPKADATGIAACEAEIPGGTQHLLFTVIDQDGLSDTAEAYFVVRPLSQIDNDGDGFTEDQGDCDDDDNLSYPGGTEIEDGADNDCDGKTDEGTSAYDDDGDGYSENEGDCDDTTTAMGPDATESCNGLDDDCDGTADTEDATGCSEYFYDYDGDGYGSSSVASKCLCTDSGYYRSGYDNDCYDYNVSASPAATSYSTAQRGDGSWDWNCDGTETKYYPSVGTCSGAVWICSWSAGWSGSVRSCGTSGSWIDGCDGILCDDSTTTVTQPCI
jgi:hypothetical protein